MQEKSKDKETETEQGASNSNQSHSLNQRMSHIDLIHDDVDETMFVENANIRLQQTKPSAVSSIESRYLFPCYSEDDNISSQTFEKDIIQSFVCSHA